MAGVIFDSKRKCLVVDLVYEQTTILVDLVPDAKSGQFTAKNARTKANVPIASEQQHALCVLAKKELMAWFRHRLNPKNEHVVVPMEERITIALVTTLLELSDSDKAKMAPLGKSDLILLTLMVHLISDKLKLEQIEARSSRVKLPVDYFQTIKQGVIYNFQKESGFSSAKRELYSSVLSRVFAWKNGRIPLEVYNQAKKHWLGMNLVFNLQ